VKAEAALDAVESGRGGGTFYRASEGADGMEAVTGGECSFKATVFRR
jgi:hypothetical protein